MALGKAHRRYRDPRQLVHQRTESANEETIAFPCSHVDYDGGLTLEDWRKQPRFSPGDRKEFVRRNGPLLTDGASHLGRYLEQVRAGRKPEHV